MTGIFKNTRILDSLFKTFVDSTPGDLHGFSPSSFTHVPQVLRCNESSVPYQALPHNEGRASPQACWPWRSAWPYWSFSAMDFLRGVIRSVESKAYIKDRTKKFCKNEDVCVKRPGSLDILTSTRPSRLKEMISFAGLTVASFPGRWCLLEGSGSLLVRTRLVWTPRILLPLSSLLASSLMHMFCFSYPVLWNMVPCNTLHWLCAGICIELDSSHGEDGILFPQSHGTRARDCIASCHSCGHGNRPSHIWFPGWLERKKASLWVRDICAFDRDWGCGYEF